MKTIKTVGPVVFGQTHCMGGSIWAHYGSVSVPLSISYDEDGKQYAMYLDTVAMTEGRVYMVTNVDAYLALPDFQ